MPTLADPNWAGMYGQAVERYHRVILDSLALAAEGHWSDLVDRLADELNNVDAVMPEDIPLYEQAKRQAARIDGRDDG